MAGALVLGLLLGAALVFVLTRPNPPGDDSAEAGFVRDMSTHHAQAVEMALVAHAATANDEIESLSSDIAITQQGQIGIMLAWLRDWQLGSTSSQPPMAWMPNSAGSVQNGLMPGMASQQQLTELRKATGTAQDIMFLNLMRQHHLGGVHMAQEILNLSDDEDVTWLAQTMVASQQNEISAIQALLKSLGQNG
ncbi:DUF305 domain-containing protein [Jidongwangia harbinensis]|uniref:DUF305 domain-containing protein n=1 Tax=Jidongwangia harbinensis TaxID=2878561 RepID=UPI001CD9D0FC|nr:DUF305 domain-containing protein [Jidongwangia harbinensis]MCA2213525.1 DUF305 domain-containing protein [Jidongwangia harbinensis]